jgi:hypothetical protein
MQDIWIGDRGIAEDVPEQLLGVAVWIVNVTNNCGCEEHVALASPHQIRLMWPLFVGPFKTVLLCNTGRALPVQTV